MADDDLRLFGNLPRKRLGYVADDENRFDIREALGAFAPEGPLPPRPRLSGKGGSLYDLAVKPPSSHSSVWSASDAAAGGMTLTNGGLTVVGSGAAVWRSVRSSISQSSGKLYVEFSYAGSGGTTLQYITGFASSSFSPGSYLGSSNYSAGLFSGGSQVSPGFTLNYPIQFSNVTTSNDVYALAIDFTAGKIFFARNNVWDYISNPVTGASPIVSFVPATVGALFAAMSFNGAGAGVWTLKPTAASQTYAPPAGFSAWDGGVAPPPTSVWSAADAAANAMTLSNGGLTVTPSGVAGNQAIRGSTSHNTGKWYIEFLANAAMTGGATAIMFGLADTTFVATNQYLGSNGKSVGVQLAGASYAISGFTALTPGTFTPVLNDVFAIAIDLDAGKAWLGVNNTWISSGNPSLGTTPFITIAAPALGVALFPGMTFYGAGNGVWTLQPTAASQKYAPPAGFSAWDGGVAPPPTSVWSATDATANAMTLSNGGLTVTPSGALDLAKPAEPKAVWQSIRTSTSKTAGKLYVELGTSAAITNFLWALGFANAGFPINTYLGSATYSCGILLSVETDVSSGFTSHYTSGLGNLPAAGAVYALAVDFAAGSIWVALNNVWSNSSNPATGTLPIISFVPATVGALFAGMSYQGVNNGVWTLQATAASQTYAPPAGFSAWG